MKMKKSKYFTKIEYEGTKYYEGTPSDIRKIVARLKKEGAVQKNDRHPLREGQLYQLEIEPKGYNIWAPGIQLKGKGKAAAARRASVWDLKGLNVLRVARPAVFRSLYYEAANGIETCHLCNAIHVVRYDEPYDVAHEAQECIDHKNVMDVDVIDNLRYAIAIMAVCITGVTGDDKRTYRYARKAVKDNRKEFLKVLLKDQIHDYVLTILEN